MGLKAARPVLYVANASKIGGGNKVLMDLMLNLDPDRFSPILVAPEPGPLAEWAASAGIPCSLSPSGDWQALGGLARRSWNLARVIKRTKAAIVHAAAPMCYRALGLAAYATGAARVCHLGFPPEEGELERSFLSGPDLVIGCYRGQADENRALIEQIAPRCRVVGITNGVDVETFAPGSPSRSAFELREGFATVVAILGHVSDVKGYPTFIDAAAGLAARHRDCLFVAIGSDSTQIGYRTALEQKVRDLRLERQFRFLGFRKDISELLRAIDIVALPSRAEGLPLAVLEAMAAGTAVVATPVGGVPEALTDGVNGLMVPPDNADALAATLERLIDSTELRRRIGREARKCIVREFSVRCFADRVQDAYDSLGHVVSTRSELRSRAS